MTQALRSQLRERASNAKNRQNLPKESELMAISRKTQQAERNLLLEKAGFPFFLKLKLTFLNFSFKYQFFIFRYRFIYRFHRAIRFRVSARDFHAKTQTRKGALAMNRLSKFTGWRAIC